MHRFRASSLGEIMADPVTIDKSLLSPELLVIQAKTKKTDEEKALLAPYFDMSLSAGAKTTIEKIAKEFIYGYDEEISSKYMEKGILVEDQSIALYNEVFFTNHEKNTVRMSNLWITGECDISTPDKIIDIKSSWSLATFPATALSGTDKGYEWQGRAYMWLWNVDQFEIAYCLVNTPDELIGYEQQDLHYVDHIAPELRVTRVQYTRDKKLEDKIKTRVEAANKYLQETIKRISAEHEYVIQEEVY